MYVAIIDMPLKEEKEEEIKTWINQTNQILSKQPGFINRRLAKSEDGRYIIIAEFADKELTTKFTKPQNTIKSLCS